jgi:hypothetical protein
MCADVSLVLNGMDVRLFGDNMEIETQPELQGDPLFQNMVLQAKAYKPDTEV